MGIPPTRQICIYTCIYTCIYIYIYIYIIFLYETVGTIPLPVGGHVHSKSKVQHQKHLWNRQLVENMSGKVKPYQMENIQLKQVEEIYLQMGTVELSYTSHT